MPAIVNHPVFRQPADRNAKLWRYMDIPKYVAMLPATGALYFARVDRLGDRYEGSLSRDEYERLEAMAAQGEAGGSIPPGWRGHYFEILMRNARVARGSNYVSCWHFGNQESDAMWRVYSESGIAVAVRSTYARLVEGLPGEGDQTCYVGLVSYSDHHAERMPGGNSFYPIMHKRRAFAHEQEVRAVMWRGDPWTGEAEELVRYEEALAKYPTGVRIDVDLAKLIERVYLSPAAPHWFLDVVRELTSKYGLSMPVDLSELLAKPYI